MLYESDCALEYVWVGERLCVLEVCVEEVIDRDVVGILGRVNITLKGCPRARLDAFEKLDVVLNLFANYKNILVALIESLVSRVEANQVKFLIRSGSHEFEELLESPRH